MSRRPIAVGLLAIVLACSTGRGGYRVDTGALPFDAIAGTTTERRWGVHQEAGYRMEVPSDWNGELLLFEHGYGGVEFELRVADPLIREHIVRKGFAWAASSYRRSGYAAGEGVEDTEALRRLFTRRFRAPTRTYLLGESMGAHVAAAAMERYPKSYQGALMACGVLGDVELFDFYLDHAVVAAALAGVPSTHPPPKNYRTEVVPAIEAALGYGPGLELTPQGQLLAAATEFLSGGERPLFDEAFAYWSGDATAIDGRPFLLALYGGALALEARRPRPGIENNAGRVYQLDRDPQTSPEEARLNADVERAARRDPLPFPVVRGHPPAKVLALLAVGDLFVPMSMSQIYATEAAAHGDTERLVVRAVRDLAHCGVSQRELEAGFDDLVTWVQDGPRPAGDDILDPDVVARPDFGCRFTLDDRPRLPPCP